MLATMIGAVVLAQFVPSTSFARRPAVVAQAPAPVPANDAVILGSINARDANLIEASTFATEKASAAEVKSFAAEILQAHERSLTRGSELAKSLNLSRELPPDSIMARSHEALMDRLSLLSGAAFDRAYMQYVLETHEAEIGKVTAAYLPGASHPTVKAMVSERMPILRTHRETASAWLAQHRP